MVLLFRKRACVAGRARKVLVRRVDVHEGVPLRVQILQISAGALRKDGVARVAIVR